MDLGNLLSGFGNLMGGGDKKEGGGMGGMLGMAMNLFGGKDKMFSMIVEKMGDPEAQEMIIEKIKEIFEFCMKRVDATSIDQITIFLRMMPTGEVEKDVNGNIILDENQKPKPILMPFWVIQGDNGKMEKLNLQQVLTLAKEGVAKFKETTDAEDAGTNGPKATTNESAPSPAPTPTT